MALDTIFWARQRADHSLLRQMDQKHDRQLANQELALALMGQILLAFINRTPTSPPSSTNPTDSPSEVPADSTSRSSPWKRRMVERIAEKFGREALSAALWWIGGRLLGWAILWVPASYLAWIGSVQPLIDFAKALFR